MSNGNAHTDAELLNWLYGIRTGSPVLAGDFLQSLAEAGLQADPENYRILRPVLLQFRAKYPRYSSPDSITEIQKTAFSLFQENILSVNEIGEKTGVSRATIYRWKQLYDEKEPKPEGGK